MKDFLIECASYEGRWNRKKFWLYHVVMYLLLTVILSIILIKMLENGNMSPLSVCVLIIFIIIFTYISICTYIKRFHDLDRSGHYTWIAFIPYIGIIAAIWGGFFKGTVGPNRFGADPLGGAASVPAPAVINNEEL